MHRTCSGFSGSLRATFTTTTEEKGMNKIRMFVAVDVTMGAEVDVAAVQKDMEADWAEQRNPCSPDPDTYTVDAARVYASPVCLMDAEYLR